MAAFSVFFMQSPSFLLISGPWRTSNSAIMPLAYLGFEKIPSDPQIRNLLDPVTPAGCRRPSGRSSGSWRRRRLAFLIAAGRSVAGLTAGRTQYFSSSKLHCAPLHGYAFIRGSSIMPTRPSRRCWLRLANLG